MRFSTRLAALGMLALLATAGNLPAARAAEPAPAPKYPIAGHWTGAKLRCQKEEAKLVRCGTPAPFEIRLDENGSGRTSDEALPKEFAWRWTSATEITVTPVGGGEEVKLFAVEQEDLNTLTFQAYVYLPTGDPNAPAETRYLHFVFDVTRGE